MNESKDIQSIISDIDKEITKSKTFLNRYLKGDKEAVENFDDELLVKNVLKIFDNLELKSLLLKDERYKGSKSSDIDEYLEKAKKNSRYKLYKDYRLEYLEPLIKRINNALD